MEIRSLQVGPIGTNCYLLCDETAKVCAVIDPGGEASRVAAAVAETGCSPCAIFLTHGHYDHTGAVAALREKWPDIPVYLNHKDQYTDDAYAMQLFPTIPNTVDYGEGDTLTVGGVDLLFLPLSRGNPDGLRPGHTRPLGGICDAALR